MRLHRGDDPDKAKRLPFTDGMKNEVVTQKLHLTGWTRQCEAAGARMIEVEYKEQLERAINGRTAMVYFLVADKHFGTYRDQPDAPGGKVSPWTRRNRWWHRSGSDSQESPLNIVPSGGHRSSTAPSTPSPPGSDVHLAHRYTTPIDRQGHPRLESAGALSVHCSKGNLLVAGWHDRLPSISLGHDAYIQELAAQGLVLVGNDEDIGDNYYYFAATLSLIHRRPTGTEDGVQWKWQAGPADAMIIDGIDMAR